MIDSNENPLGPAKRRGIHFRRHSSRRRYLDNLTEDLVNNFAQLEGLNRTTHTSFLAQPPASACRRLLHFRRRKAMSRPIPAPKPACSRLRPRKPRVVKVPLTKKNLRA